MVYSKSLIQKVIIYMSVLTVKRFLATLKKNYRLNRHGGCIEIIRLGRSISVTAP